MAIQICQCKYRWSVINDQCINCNNIVLLSEWLKRPQPPVTMDQIADAVKFFIRGPNEVYIMAEEIAKKATDDDSDLPDPLV